MRSIKNDTSQRTPNLKQISLAAIPNEIALETKVGTDECSKSIPRTQPGEYM